MAFGKDKDKFWIADSDLYSCAVDSTTDAITADQLLGYMDGEKTISVSQEFAKFVEGIPQTKVRSDLIGQTIQIQGMLKQWDADVLGLALNNETELSSGSYSYAFGGTEPGTQTVSGYYLKSKRVDGKEIYFVIRKGRIMTEDVSIVNGNQDYTSLPITIEAELDPDVTDKQRDLYFWKIED
jgi:hypothetical protein